MSDWAKKLSEIDCLIEHASGCSTRFGKPNKDRSFYTKGNCNCGVTEALKIIKIAAKHIKIVEELLEAIIPDLECIRVYPLHKFLFDACLDDLKTLLDDDTKPLYKPKS